MDSAAYKWVYDQLLISIENGYWVETLYDTDAYVSSDLMYCKGAEFVDEDDVTEAVVMIRGDRFRRAIYEIDTFGHELPDIRRLAEEAQNEDQARSR